MGIGAPALEAELWRAAHNMQYAHTVLQDDGKRWKELGVMRRPALQWGALVEQGVY